MPAPEHLTDPHGFRLPQRFEGSEPSSDLRQRYSRRLRQLAGLVMVVGLVLFLSRSQLVDIGRRAMANYYLNRAEPLTLVEDYAGALVELDRAVSWHDDNPLVYWKRAELYAKTQQLDAAIADYTAALERIPASETALRSHLYQARSIIYQRQRKPQAALAEIERAYEIRAAKDDQLLNLRAYTRAVFNLEPEAALKDIQQAIEWADVAPHAAYLDTRGYVYFRLGRYSEALADLEHALELTEAERAKKISAAQNLSPRQRDALLKFYDHNLAVMYYHRGEVHERLGNRSQAETDKKKGVELGYDFEAGVF